MFNKLARTRLEVAAGGYLDEEMDEPGSDTCPHNVDEEVANGEEPGEGVLEALLCQGLHDAGLVLGSSYTHRHRWTSSQCESVRLSLLAWTYCMCAMDLKPVQSF